MGNINKEQGDLISLVSKQAFSSGMAFCKAKLFKDLFNLQNMDIKNVPIIKLISLIDKIDKE